MGEVVDEGIWPCTGGQAGQMPGVVFDSGAVADLLHHFEVVHCPGLEPLGLEELAFAAELREAVL